MVRDGLRLRSFFVPDVDDMPIIGIFDHKPERLEEVKVERPDDAKFVNG